MGADLKSGLYSHKELYQVDRGGGGLIFHRQFVNISF